MTSDLNIKISDMFLITKLTVHNSNMSVYVFKEILFARRLIRYTYVEESGYGCATFFHQQ